MRLTELWIKLIVLFVAVVSTGFIILFTTTPAYFDTSYYRVTTPKQKSLVLGTSRAAQGLIPEYLNKRLEEKAGINPLFNFSFTLANSPFGKHYLELVKKKLDEKPDKGLFILAVDPWSISSTLNEIEVGKPREESNILYKLHSVNINPNLEYVFYDNTRLGFLLLEKDNRMSLKADGWLEVDIPLDSMSVKKRTNSKIQEYQKNKKTFKFSEVRLSYLSETITYLKNFGQVVLVRMPVSPKIMEIENEYMPDFDHKMNILSEKKRVPMFNFFNTSDSLIFTDGNHLAKPSAIQVSNMLADSILIILDKKRQYESRKIQ